MTQDPNEPNERPEGGSSERDQGPGRKLDEDAVWRAIVENYGERAQLEPEPPEPPSPSAREERLRGLFQPAWEEPQQTEATWEDEGHFIPPDPPPMPALDPRRRAAWVGLFGSPLLMLVAVVLGWQFPEWVMLLLALSFAGGFVYLVATMQNRRHGGDDGAVV